MYRIREVDGYDDDIAETLADLHRLTFFDSASVPAFDRGHWWLAYHETIPVAFAGSHSVHACPQRGISLLKRWCVEEILWQRPSIAPDACAGIACATQWMAQHCFRYHRKHRVRGTTLSEPVIGCISRTRHGLGRVRCIGANRSGETAGVTTGEGRSVTVGGDLGCMCCNCVAIDLSVSNRLPAGKGVLERFAGRSAYAGSCLERHPRLPRTPRCPRLPTSPVARWRTGRFCVWGRQGLNWCAGQDGVVRHQPLGFGLMAFSNVSNSAPPLSLVPLMKKVGIESIPSFLEANSTLF